MIINAVTEVSTNCCGDMHEMLPTQMGAGIGWKLSGKTSWNGAIWAEF